MPEAFPGAIISFPMLGESFSLNPSGTYTLFGHTFYWYGAIIGLGFVLAVIYCLRRGPKEFGVSADTLTDVVILALPAGIIGARLYYVLCHWSNYVGDTALQTLWNCCKIWEGGTAIPGGLIVGVLAIWLYSRKKKIPFGAIMDCLVFGLLIGQIIGRWSNFMNREYIGEVTDIFCRMGLTVGDTTYYVHPLFLYESLWNLVGFIALSVWSKRGGRQYDGQATLLYFIWYGLIRFLLEPLRTSPLLIPGTTLRASQVLCGGMCLAALIVLLVQSRRPHRKEDLYVNRVRAESAEAADNTSAEETQTTETAETSEPAEKTKEDM